MSLVTPLLAVAFDKPRQRERAQQLADRLDLPLAKRHDDTHELHLAVAANPKHGDRLELRVPTRLASDHPFATVAGGHPVAAEPHLLDVTSPAGRKLNSPLFKAVGVRKGNPRRPHVLDATAGFGEDAWLLAAAGCQVTAYERHPIVHALLEDALKRAQETHPDIASRITLQQADLLDGSPTPDTRHPIPACIYLDPMFPTGRKTAEKKPMRLLRWLLGNDEDADALLHAAQALLLPGGRVVVKRPRHAPFLAAHPPLHSHEAKALRYDVYLTA